eukprot:TRINITY_DN14277_c0_g1_i1.p1 TRINITY_DN14277_c0_g1~~TRINITY_DN14277_c0_g1_i1.p1  ORF type:complete len:225 (-),score=1.55 TRINITY_DN14277_c0_g1_i1:52-648(-)
MGGAAKVPTYSTCGTCTIAGNNWCESAAAQGGCYDAASTAASAACNQMVNDQMDAFVPASTPYMCMAAGCSIEYIDQCASAGVLGCGWCYKGGSSDTCIAGVRTGTGVGNATRFALDTSKCQAWVVGTTFFPCPTYEDCASCARAPSCSWCTANNVSSCTSKSTSCITSPETCPGFNAASHLEMGLVVLALLCTLFGF